MKKTIGFILALLMTVSAYAVDDDCARYSNSKIAQNCRDIQNTVNNVRQTIKNNFTAQIEKILQGSAPKAAPTSNVHLQSEPSPNVAPPPAPAPINQTQPTQRVKYY